MLIATAPRERVAESNLSLFKCFLIFATLRPQEW